MIDERTVKARAMLDVVERAYPSRVAEVVEWTVDDLLRLDPELFASIDVTAYRRELERQLRAMELDELHTLAEHIAELTKEKGT